MRALYSYLSLISLLLLGCTSAMTPEKLISWLDNKDNGCVKEIDQNEFVLKAKYIPADLMAYKQVSILGEEPSDSIFSQLVEEFSNGHFFILDIILTKESASTKEFAEENTEYLNFYLSRDLSLITGGDTIPCAFAHMERATNIANRLRFDIAFERNKKIDNEDLVLIYNGDLIQEPSHFQFSNKNLNSIPKLKR